MKPSEPRALGVAITAVIKELGIGARLKEYEVCEAWSEIVGEQIAAVAIPERVEGGKLYLHVTRSTWRNELVFLKQELIGKINRRMQQEVITEIIFR